MVEESQSERESDVKQGTWEHEGMWRRFKALSSIKF